jgi:hypothetical protein
MRSKHILIDKLRRPPVGLNHSIEREMEAHHAPVTDKKALKAREKRTKKVAKMIGKLRGA